MAKIVIVILQVEWETKKFKDLKKLKKITDTREHWVSILCFLEVGVGDRGTENMHNVFYMQNTVQYKNKDHSQFCNTYI